MDIERSDPQSEMARRTFLKFAGATALGVPATTHARADAPPNKRPESTMEIKRVGSQPSGKGRLLMSFRLVQSLPPRGDLRPVAGGFV
jgi:hypothetical protein